MVGRTRETPGTRHRTPGVTGKVHRERGGGAATCPCRRRPCHPCPCRRRRHGLVDLLAHGTHGVLLRVTARHPHLAAERDDGRAVQRARHDLVLLDIVGVALVIAVAVRRLWRRLYEGPRTCPALGLKSAHNRQGYLSPPGPGTRSVERGVVRIRGHHRQFTPLAPQHRAPQPLGTGGRDITRLRLDDVPGALGQFALQLSRAPARVAGEDPQGAERRREQLGGASRSTRPMAPCTRRQPSGASRSSSPGITATPSAESSETGPPWNTTPGSPARSPQPSRMSPTSTGVGRFSTTPSEPSSSWSRSSTTARSKFGSARAGVATSSRPVSEDTSVMRDMIPHLPAVRGAKRNNRVNAAQGTGKWKTRTSQIRHALCSFRRASCCSELMTLPDTRRHTNKGCTALTLEPGPALLFGTRDS